MSYGEKNLENGVNASSYVFDEVLWQNTVYLR